jgi:putative hydrolase of HD superfamily
MAEEELHGLARYAYEVGQLKRSKRTGWWLAGIADPESVAEHTFRTALLGYVLAVMEGADPERTAALCLFHDTAETRLGDIPSVGKRYLTQAPAADVVADQLADLPPEVAAPIARLVDEYEAQDSPEARVAKDADKLECLIQAREYEAQGYQDAASWVAPSAASIRTASGRRLAASCQAVPPRQWWKSFVDSYIRPAPPAEHEPPTGENDSSGPTAVAR